MRPSFATPVTMILCMFQFLLAAIELSQLIIRISLELTRSLLALIIPVPKKSVDGQVILITGAGSGIGRQLAVRFAQLRAILVLWDNNQDSVNRTAKMIRDRNGQAYSYVVDVGDEKQVEEAAARVTRDVGDVRILVNNAGVCVCKPFKTLSAREVKRSFQVNALSHFWTMKHFLSRMEEAGAGHIVSIASSAGIRGSPYFTAYGSSKFAAVGLMESLRQELHALRKDSLITLTTVCPLGISGTGIDIPTRTRFPRFMPIMTLDYASEKIVDAILRNEKFVVIPPGFKLIHLLLQNLPDKVGQIIFEFLDYTIELPGNDSN